MGGRVAEHRLRTGRFGRRVRARVDLHGVSIFGPGKARRLIRWEWIQEIVVGDGVKVRSASDELILPPGSFGCAPHELAQLLEEARSIAHRSDVLVRLSAHASGP